MSRFVDQTEVGATGNCFSACLASLFAMKIDDVPNFFHIAYDESAEAWWKAVRGWLKDKGYGVMSLSPVNTDILSQYDGIFIVSGKSCRGIEHAVLYQHGKIIHDPHPSKCGVESIECVDLLYPLDPSKLCFNASNNDAT